MYLSSYQNRKKKIPRYCIYILLFYSTILNANQISSFYINPYLTDYKITKNLDQHYIYLPHDSKNYNNKLLVFLPGTGAKPAHYNAFNTFAASLGFHVISLSYMNRQKLFQLCSKKPEGCYEKTCREIIDGIDRSPDINIKPENSTKNRLLKLLRYLNDKYPDKSWDQFYDKENILWNKITLAGHSQGGEIAGIIAKHNIVQRVIFFNSPNGIILRPHKKHELAAWITNDNQTDSSRYYGFYHKANTGKRKHSIYTKLSMLKFGTETNILNLSIPSTNTHVVYSNFKADNPHSAIIMDKYLPSDHAKKEIIKNAWKYLLLHTDKTLKETNATKSLTPKKCNLKEKAHTENRIEDLPLIYITL